MSLDAFLHDLHFDIDKVRPLDMEVDWNDAPLPYKLYRKLPVVPLPTDISLRLEPREQPRQPDLRDIGQLLWYVFGLTQVSQSVVASDSPQHVPGVMQALRRFVPSGGALYPNELYVYLKIEDLPMGVYHYDVAHHSLVLLREGNFDRYVTQALGQCCDLTTCFGTIFVSTMFWKNYYKYNNFSYRLQGLDAGVLLGQILEVSKRFSYGTSVYFQFLDRAVNHLVGLSEQEESIYAIVPMSIEPSTRWFTTRNAIEEPVTATGLSKELPGLQHSHYIRSKRKLDFPLLIQMNEAAMLETIQVKSINERTQKLSQVKNTHRIQQLSRVSLPTVKPLTYDFAEVCRSRFSPGIDFILKAINQQQLATLFQEAFTSYRYRNDLDQGESQAVQRVSLYGCLYNVEGISDGAYRYDSSSHTLWSIHPGDHRYTLQQGMTMHNINLSQVPLCLHVAGDQDHFQSVMGYRGYRIQQMEVGMLVQRLALCATALEMGGHPLLGYETQICDEIYKLDQQGLTSLIQIPVGPYRVPPRLQGSLRG